jgi:hypothetical protein
VAINALADIELPALLRRLGSDHRRIARANAQLAEIADRLADIDSAGAVGNSAEESGATDQWNAASQQWDEAADLLGFEHHFANHIHHPLEDRLFEALLLKGLTPTERHLAFRNLGQHQEIVTMTDELSAMVSSGQHSPLSGIPQFYERVAEYLALQRRHMTFEEMHMFPLLISRLDNEDWNQLDVTLGAQFPKDVPNGVPNNEPNNKSTSESESETS